MPIDTRLRAHVGRALLAALVAGVSLAPGQAQEAQTPQPPAGRGEGAPAADTLPTAELVAMLDTFAIVQAQNALNLNDEQYARFIPLIKKLQETRRRSQRERNRLIQDLRRLAGPQATPPIDEAAVRDTLRLLREHDVQAAAAMQQAYDALDQVLDLRQQARFRMFEETIERRKLDLLVRARQRAARGGGDR